MVQTPGQPGCQCKTPKFYRPCPRARTNTVFCAGAAMVKGSKAPPGRPWCSMRATWGGAARGAVCGDGGGRRGHVRGRDALPMAGHGGPAHGRCLARHAGLAGHGLQPQDRAAAPEHRQQYAAGVVLGALAGAYACAMLKLAWWRRLAPMARQRRLRGPAVSHAGHGAGAARAWPHPAATTARLTELQSRIRPHFLFNTLNSAIALVRAEPAKAESLLEDLSDLFRHALVEQGESVTLAEEITLAQRYLGN